MEPDRDKMLGYGRFAFWLYLQGVRPINQLIFSLDGSAKNAKSRQLTLQGEETDVHLVPPKYFFTFCFRAQKTNTNDFVTDRYRTAG